MSLTQQIRDAMRRFGGPATAKEIAELVEDDTDSKTVIKRLANGLRHGWAQVDTDSKPARYMLDVKGATKVEKELRGKHHASRPAQPGKAKRQLKQRQARAAAPTPPPPPPVLPARTLSVNITGAPNGLAEKLAEAVEPVLHKIDRTAKQSTAAQAAPHAHGKPVDSRMDTIAARFGFHSDITLDRSEFFDLAALALAGARTDETKLRIADLIKAHA